MTGADREPYAGRSGAPGWNRTSDTRFRKRQAGVLCGGRSHAIVLHGLGFWVGSVLNGRRWF